MFEEGRGQYYSVPPGVASLGILATLLGILAVARHNTLDRETREQKR